jgi:hypothetical protein
MIRLSFNGSDTRVAEQLEATTPRMMGALVYRLDALDTMLQSKIVAEKLQGEVLHHRTGKLSGSIRTVAAIIAGDQITGSVEGAGGPAWYGRVHEDGGVYDVPEHMRRVGFNVKGETVKLLTGRGAIRKEVFGVEERPVRAHTITFPQRSFMASTQRENEPEFIEALQDTMDRTVDEHSA